MNVPAVVLAKAWRKPGTTTNHAPQLLRDALSSVMPGLDPGIHVFRGRGNTWMAGTSPAMTRRVCDFLPHFCSWLWVRPSPGRRVIGRVTPHLGHGASNRRMGRALARPISFPDTHDGFRCSARDRASAPRHNSVQHLLHDAIIRAARTGRHVKGMIGALDKMQRRVRA